MADSEPKKENSRSGTKLMLVILIVVVIGGFWFLSRYKVEFSKDGGLAVRSSSTETMLVFRLWGHYIVIIPRETAESPSSPPKKHEPKIKMPPLRDGRGDRIQVATFNAGPLDEVKFSSDAVVTHLANTICHFDLVALQNLRVRDPGKLDLITKQLNARGRHYEYVISPGQASSTGVFNAFLFDRASVEVDRDKVFDWVDPHERFSVRPLSAMFRVRGPATNQAFTFVAINVYIDPTERENELGLLPEVLDAVKQNYPGEDDMILFGSFQAAPGDLGVIENEPGITHVAEGLTSMVQNDYLADNILFDRRATIEYVGEWGVYDLGRGLRLKPAQTLEVTRHLPVWAKFSIYEGGRFIK